MMRVIFRILTVAAVSPIMLQLGCFNPSDLRAILEGQFISLVNALINSVTSDAITALLGG